MMALFLFLSIAPLILAQELAQSQDLLTPQTQPSDWLTLLQSKQARVHSQRGQDGMLLWIFYHIGATSQSFVEFGFNSPLYEQEQSGSNTKLLYEIGWRGLL